MPNIQMYYTANLPAQDKLEAFAQQVHTLLAPIVVTEVGNFKTFLNPISRYVSGAGNPNKAFLQIDFRMLPGRSPQVKQAAAEIVLAQAAEHFSVENGVETSITVEIGEIDKENYHKVIVNQ